MSDENMEHNNKLIFSVTTICCLTVGFLYAFLLSQDTFGYITWTVTIISFVLGIPLLLILVITAAICFDSENYRVYGLAILLSCFLLPVSAVASSKILETTRLARQRISDFGEMHPIGSELNERIVIAFKNNAPQDEIHKFDETTLRKTVPQPNGVLLEFTDGVCGIMCPNTEFKYKIADVGFCNYATDEQKKLVKDKVNSSTVVYKVFENLRTEEIKNLPLDKK